MALFNYAQLGLLCAVSLCLFGVICSEEIPDFWQQKGRPGIRRYLLDRRARQEEQSRTTAQGPVDLPTDVFAHYYDLNPESPATSQHHEKSAEYFTIDDKEYELKSDQAPASNSYNYYDYDAGATDISGDYRAESKSRDKPEIAFSIDSSGSRNKEEKVAHAPQSPSKEETVSIKQEAPQIQRKPDRKTHVPAFANLFPVFKPEEQIINLNAFLGRVGTLLSQKPIFGNLAQFNSPAQAPSLGLCNGGGCPGLLKFVDDLQNSDFMLYLTTMLQLLKEKDGLQTILSFATDPNFADILGNGPTKNSREDSSFLDYQYDSTEPRVQSSLDSGPDEYDFLGYGDYEYDTYSAPEKAESIKGAEISENLERKSEHIAKEESIPDIATDDVTETENLRKDSPYYSFYYDEA